MSNLWESSVTMVQAGPSRTWCIKYVHNYVNNDLISSRHIFSLLSNWSPRIVPTDLPVSWPSFRNHWISVKISSDMPLIKYRLPRDISILPKNHYSRRFHCQNFVSHECEFFCCCLLTYQEQEQDIQALSLEGTTSSHAPRSELWKYLFKCVMVWRGKHVGASELVQVD